MTNFGRWTWNGRYVVMYVHLYVLTFEFALSALSVKHDYAYYANLQQRWD